MSEPMAALTSGASRAARSAARAASLPEQGSHAERIGVGVLGATGYSGLELIRLLASHPGAVLRAAGSRQAAGAALAQVWPAHPGLDLVLDDDPSDPAAWLDRGVQAVFSALPHGAFAARAEAFLEAGLRVVDLSADFRLRDPGEYRRRYGLEHPAPHLLGSALYGLAEWCGTELEAARLVANPGCYATAVLLATLPAVAAGWWSGAPIVANALSGVSGAGRAPSLGTHFVEVAGGASPYKVGEVHAHLGEMRQALGRVRAGDSVGDGIPRSTSGSSRAGQARHAGQDLPLLFSPHLVPMSRGIVASIAVPLARSVSEEDALVAYGERYADHPFVRVLEGEVLPETRWVRGSNRCDIAIRVGAGGTMLLAYAALDNLIKGAAGQAIQSWNRMQGWSETSGLPLDGWAVA